VDLTIESLGRFAVVAAAVIQMLAGLAVLLRQVASRRPAPSDRVQGPLGLVNFAGLAGFVVTATAVALTGAGAMFGERGAVGDAVRLCGVAVLVLAGILAATGVRAMGRHLVAPAEVRPDTELITGGPFGLVRHPLYASIELLWAGGALALLSPPMAVVPIALAPAIYLRAAAEERLLRRHFGSAWATYAGRVPMLVPRLRRRR
jgi:protein-S-isoprenylcysteine O-methyltransferase Ste14